jgi:putative endonuclease
MNAQARTVGVVTAFEQITDAIAAERQLKGWSRAKKEALIRGDWNSVQSLAKRRAGKPKNPL